MTTPNDAARPYGWLIRKGASDMWAYCDNEEDADFYGKQSGLRYEKLALYTAADYDALREELALQLLRDTQLCGAVALLTARAEAAEAKVSRLSVLLASGTITDQYASRAMRAALNEGDGE